MLLCVSPAFFFCLLGVIQLDSKFCVECGTVVCVCHIWTSGSFVFSNPQFFYFRALHLYFYHCIGTFLVMLSPHGTRHHHGRSLLAVSEDISRRIPPRYHPYKTAGHRCKAMHGDNFASHLAGASPPLPAARYAIIGAGIAGLATAWNLLVR